MKLEDATVLIVDDEPDLREIFTAWLERTSRRVIEAPNGAEALKILETEKVDALLSDIRMPVMDGVTLVRTIFARKLVVPCIMFVSGYADMAPREMYGLGVEALIEKPLTRNDLIRTLRQSLLEREEHWLTRSAVQMGQNLTMELEGFESSRLTSQFQLGSGGCCFSSARTLVERKTVNLSFQFIQEGLNLNAQGTVRWTDEETAQSGVSFDYLEPDCREWVIDAMRDESSRSFIPHGRATADNLRISI